MEKRDKRPGFSLIEVNLAIFVVGIGMLTLFSLFPSGLRQVESAHANTQEALFADFVFSTLRAEARLLSASDWSSAVLQNKLTANWGLTASGYSGSTSVRRALFPEVNAGDDVQYMLYILQTGQSGNLLTARLWCLRGEFGPRDEDEFKKQATSFYTEFVFSGME